MLFISNVSDYTQTLRRAEPIYTPKGDLLAIKPKIKAVFRHGTAPRWAIEQAKQAGMVVTGKPDGTDFDPYFSSYDTNAAAELEGWDEETKAWVEGRLLANPAFGSTYILAEPVRLKPPWPAYDDLLPKGQFTEEMVAEKIGSVTLESGYDPAVVVAYEAENLNRALVIKELEDIIALEAAELVQA